VAGWPKEFDPGLLSSPVLGDLNNDGLLDVIIGTGLNETAVFAWKSDGTWVRGWPNSVNGSIFSTPALGDLDAESTGLEVVVGTSTGYIYIWDCFGHVLDGWPKHIDASLASPAIGDINNDGQLDIFVGTSNGDMYAWNVNGTTVIGWPKQTGASILSSPILGDIDGNSEIDVLIGTVNGLHLWLYPNMSHIGSYTGEISSPKLSIPIHSSPLLGDIDGDGNTEIIIGSLDTNVYIWSTGKIFNPRYIPWGMSKGTPQRTGRTGDYDGDGLSNIDELDHFNTDPCSSDPDHDGLSDRKEIYCFTNPWVADRDLDLDKDGLTNVNEVLYYRTDPLTPDATSDTDEDGFLNVDEVDLYGTDPTLFDTDGDGLSDYDEIRYRTNPNNPDTDGDGINDLVELRWRLDPRTADLSKQIGLGTNIITIMVIIALLPILTGIFVFLSSIRDELRWRISLRASIENRFLHLHIILRKSTLISKIHRKIRTIQQKKR